jgi:hypothetical protein
MLSRFIRRLKNRAVKQKRKPQEVIETDLSWIWQPFENSSNLQFSASVKKIAAAIIESSADDIPTITFELDPRLVIPLCAIQLQNEIDLTQLSSFKNELESVSIENLDAKIEFVDRVLNKITPKQRWLYLFNSLTPELQFTLLSCLIDYRRPTRNDWRNLFKKIEYEFKTSPEYLGVLTVVFLLSLGFIIEIFAIMLSQSKSWVNGLMAITMVVVFSFLEVLLREIITEEDKSEPTLLMKLGLLGPWTFYREWQRLLRKNLVWEGITALDEAVGEAAVAAFLAMAVALEWAGVAMAVAWAGAAAIGFGLGIWYRAKEETDLEQGLKRMRDEAVEKSSIVKKEQEEKLVEFNRQNKESEMARGTLIISFLPSLIRYIYIILEAICMLVMKLFQTSLHLS